jgi:hypothetical protein
MSFEPRYSDNTLPTPSLDTIYESNWGKRVNNFIEGEGIYRDNLARGGSQVRNPMGYVQPIGGRRERIGNIELPNTPKDINNAPMFKNANYNMPQKNFTEGFSPLTGLPFDYSIANSQDYIQRPGAVNGFTPNFSERAMETIYQPEMYDTRKQVTSIPVQNLQADTNVLSTNNYNPELQLGRAKYIADTNLSYGGVLPFQQVWTPRMEEGDLRVLPRTMKDKNIDGDMKVIGKGVFGPAESITNTYNNDSYLVKDYKIGTSKKVDRRDFDFAQMTGYQTKPTPRSKVLGKYSKQSLNKYQTNGYTYFGNAEYNYTPGQNMTDSTKRWNKPRTENNRLYSYLGNKVDLVGGLPSNSRIIPLKLRNVKKYSYMGGENLDNTGGYTRSARVGLLNSNEVNRSKPFVSYSDSVPIGTIGSLTTKAEANNAYSRELTIGGTASYVPGRATINGAQSTYSKLGMNRNKRLF